MSGPVYLETFDNGPGGWVRVVDNVQPVAALLIRDGAVQSYGPWWVDYNHAPPGGGYLQLLMCLHTKGPFGERLHDVGGPNRFVLGGFPRDFRNAKVTVRIKGELEPAGAQVCLLIQGSDQGKVSGWVLTGQPVQVEPYHNEQTLTLVSDVSQWCCLGSRHDRQDMYGTIPLDTILGNVNVNLYLVLFPVTPRPMGVIDGDRHRLRAGRDYPIWPSSVPQGYVCVDTVRIDFP